MIKLVEVIQKKDKEIRQLNNQIVRGEMEQCLRRIEDSLVKIAQGKLASRALSFADMGRRGVVASTGGSCGGCSNSF